MIDPKTMPPTRPHGELPKSRSAPQPMIIIKTTEAKKAIPADQASPLFLVVSAKLSGSMLDNTKFSLSAFSAPSDRQKGL